MSCPPHLPEMADQVVGDFVPACHLLERKSGRPSGGLMLDGAGVQWGGMSPC